MTHKPLHNTQSNSLVKVSTWLAVILSSLLLLAPLLPRQAGATDLSPTLAGAQPNSHYFRIALNKSAVVSLPADARDVIVGNNDIVDVVIRNKSTAYLFARKTGATNIFFFDVNNQQIMQIDLEVALDVAPLQNLIRRTIPGTHITVDILNSNVILGGIAMNAQEAKIAVDLANEYIGQPTTTTNGLTTVTSGGGLIVNTIKIAGEDQVNLQVKIVEIQRDVLKQWGINFGAIINAGSFAFNLSSLNPFSSVDTSPGQGYGASFADGAGNGFTSIIKAMESDGMLHTLAEPNLTALSGQAASFKAGGEFPYQTCNISTTSRTCEVKFKEYGIGLDFTPTVLTEGRINLKIHTAVSELTDIQTGTTGTPLGQNAGSIPSVNVRAADTVLEMPDGGSMMLAGLIRENTRSKINGTPGLRKLPILGALFRSREFIQNQTELVILVTPHIVRSVAQKQLELPDKNLNLATDTQTLLMDRLTKIYGPKGKVSNGKYTGKVGYIVE